MRIEEEIKQQSFKNEHQKAAINILFTSNWLNTLHAQTLKPYGISPQQFNVLRILRGQNPQAATVNLLIDRMLDKSSNVSRLVEKLRLKDFVKRGVDSEDRRAVAVEITKKGLKLLEQLDKEEQKWLEKLSVISEKEARQLNNILDKLRNSD